MLIKTISTSLVLTTIILFSACSSNKTNKTPKCSDLDVINTLSNMLSTNDTKAIIDIGTVRKKLDLSEQNSKRTCRAKVDYIYNVDEKSKNNQIIYSVISSETDKKYIIKIIEQ